MNRSQPEKFGKYELLKRLAFGGMAEIFLARLLGESGFSKQLVVKRILPQFGEDAQFVKMFIDEAVLAAYINHPNVVQVYDFGSTDNVYFIAMEFVDGADLKQILRDQAKLGSKLSFAAVAAVGEGVAAGLASAHVAKDPDGVDLKLVHRDVSPHNIMVGRGGDVKVMDFGIARAEVRATKTATGTIKGKVAYMAPEHGSGDQADGRSDQFSLGAVLWEALAGERLYGGDSELEVLRNVLDCRVRDIREVRTDVPEVLATIVMRMLEREPADRYDTLLEVRDELSRFRFTLGAEGSVDLGKLIGETKPSPIRSSGTLVLDEPTATQDSTAETLGRNDPSSLEPSNEDDQAAITATMPPDQPELASTATLPMDPVAQERTATGSTVAETRPSKLWAALLVMLMGGALFWISQAGQSRMDKQVKEVQVPVAINKQIQVISNPAGAAIWINEELSHQVTPATLEPQALGTSLQLTLKFNGYEDWTTQVEVSNDSAPISAKLTKRAQPTAASRPKAGKRSAKTIKKASKPSKRHIITSKKRLGAKDAGAGRLFLRSGGLWFHVYLEGEKLGTTPLAGVSIPAGRHTLKLKNDVAGIERKLVVDVKPGTTIRRTVTSEE